jgi:hypothetical protein
MKTNFRFDRIVNLVALLILFAGSGFSSRELFAAPVETSLTSQTYTFQPTSTAYNYNLALPATSPSGTVGVFEVSAAVEASGSQCGSSSSGTWSISAVTFEAENLSGYPASVTTTPVSSATFQANEDNGCSTRITFSGLTNGAVNLNVTNANGATVSVSVTSLTPSSTSTPSDVLFKNFDGVNDGFTSTALGIGWVRGNNACTWPTVEASKGTFNYSACDTWVEGINAKGAQIVMLLAYTPSWSGGGSGIPATSDWTTFVQAMVTRYSAAPFNVHYFEIWNEPTKAAGFWSGTDEQYVDILLNPAAPIIRAAGGHVVAPRLANQQFNLGIDQHAELR